MNPTSRRPRRWRTSRMVLLGIATVVASIAGCGGEVGGRRGTGDTGGAGGDTPGTGGTGIGKAGSGGASGGTSGTSGVKDAIGPAAEFSGNPSLLRRLTRDELVTTLIQLTGAAPARTDLPEDPRSGHGPLLIGGVSFVSVEVQKLYDVLGTFAKTVAPSMLMKSGCNQTGAAQQTCLTTWSATFGPRALRRPLRMNETDSLKTIFSTATGVAAADADLMQSALMALFFSPSFMYRTEIGTPISGKPTLRALSSDEVAAKLSFLATLGPPDTDLADAARTGKLNDGGERGRQFLRLAATPAGAHAQAVLILEWMGANESKFSTKGQKYVDGLTAGTEAGFRTSAEQVIGKILTSGDGATLTNLLTTDAYLNDPVVSQLTQAGKGGGVVTGDQPDQPRLGLLMHPQVLASHTKDNGSSPFGIGAFVREAILCQPIAPPPPGATNMTRNDPPPGLSLREDLEYRTSAAPLCIGCHSQFAPIGYSFLPFDPVGRWIKQDPSGKPWALAGTTALYRGDALNFNSPSELTRNLARDPQVFGCFAQIAVQWSRGRKLTQEDEPLLLHIDAIAKSTSGNVPKLLQAIVEDTSFVTAVGPR